MFDKEFYPTPSRLLEEILQGYDFSGCNVLEPSAGKGDILDYILEHKTNYRQSKDYLKKRFYCIEKNKELQFILKEKGYKLIDEDFLNHNSDYIYDYIIMNPPFSNGDEHLLKAWEISKGAEVICILNAETVKNPYSKKRKLLLNIIEQYGTVEFKEGMFKNAERSTNVEVAVVKIKNKDYVSDFKFTGKGEVDEFNLDEGLSNQLQMKDTFGNMEVRFNKVRELMKEMLQMQNQIKFYSEGLLSSVYNDINKLLSSNYENSEREYYNNFMGGFKSACWETLLTKTNLANLTTTKVRQDFYKFKEEQGFMAFTKENMEGLFEQLYLNQGNIMTKCIEEAFDEMTKYHKENRVYIEGWKTNDQWKVNRKVILPNMQNSWWNDHPKLNKEKIIDIEKAMCFIMKKSYKDIDRITDQDIQWGVKHDSEFFEFRLYKKGTLHLYFKDVYLYEQFNIIACKSKNWLGGK
jgi:hypothetical protein